MSVEPVTITTKLDTPVFDPEAHRKAAAEQLGLDPTDVRLLGMPPLTFDIVQAAEWSPEVYSEDGTLLKPRELIQPEVLSYTHQSTWGEAPWRVPPPEPEPEIIPWPALTLPRGARYHGPVTLDGVTTEESFISDGAKLVLVGSPEGEAVLAALEGEHAAHQAATSPPPVG